MARRTRILGVALGLSALLLVPAAAPAQIHPAAIHAQAAHAQAMHAQAAHAQAMHAQAFRPNIFNTLGNGYLNSVVTSRALYTNAYLNNAVGNINAAFGAANGTLYSNALLTNAVLGNTNPAAVNTLANAYANNIATATNYYANAYLNHALGNAVRFNGGTNALLYNSLLPNYHVARYATLYNPYTGAAANYSALSSPYGNFYNVAATRSPYVGNFYPYYNGYSLPNMTAMNYGYPNPYAAYAQYYGSYNPYTAFNSYNPYNYINPYAYNPYSVLYNPYMYTPGSTLYSPYGAPGSAAASNIYSTSY